MRPERSLSIDALKVLYVHQYFVPPDGVGGIRSLQNARKLVESGHAVIIITSSACFPNNYVFHWPISRIVIDGIEIVVLRIAYSNRFSFLRRLVSFGLFALSACFVGIFERGVTLVFATSTPLTVAIPAYVLKRILRVPLVFEVRDLWPDLPIAVGSIKHPVLKWLARTLERKAYASSRYIVALSPGIKDKILYSGIAEKRVHVITNYSDPSQASYRGIAKGGMADFVQLQGFDVVTYAGSFGKINGISYLVDVASEMALITGSVKFLLIGDGLEWDQVNSQAIKLGLAEKSVLVRKSIKRVEMTSIFRSSALIASIFIDLPAMWDNSANKVFDAFSASRPLLINYQGWQADLIERTGAGMIIPACDPKASARLIAEFLGDHKRRERSAIASRDLGANRFSCDRQFPRLLSLLEAASTGC